MNSYIERKILEWLSSPLYKMHVLPEELQEKYGNSIELVIPISEVKSALQEQQEMILKSFINHIISRKEKGYEDRTIIEELENNFILEGIIRDISE